MSPLGATMEETMRDAQRGADILEAGDVSSFSSRAAPLHSLVMDTLSVKELPPKSVSTGPGQAKSTLSPQPAHSALKVLK
mmetsp:Transcript_11365/g.33470  ORF Transcript_11365/g.33470 Transcript_11365/m.33470 type:complete len:80 (+) Transcript_11365:293-532(+)